jgi:hypothetical protein
MDVETCETMAKFALIKSQSRYGAMRCFIDDLARGVRERGHDCVVLDLSSFMLGDLGDRLKAEGRLDVVFSFNICGEYRDQGGRSIRQITGAPHVVQFVDHPLHHLARLEAMSPDAAILVVDRSHVRAIKTLYGEDRFAFVGFGPHGALGEPARLPDSATAFAVERPIRVLFAGTLTGPDRPQWEGFPNEVRAAFAAAANAALSREWLPALQAVDDVLIAAGLDPTGAGQPPEVVSELKSLRQAAITVHDWVRGQRRLALLKAAAVSGLPLTVIGEGYGNLFAHAPNVELRGPVEFPEALALMRRSRLVLNANANFGEGSHERPLTAMVAGAAAATDTSTFYETEFADGREIALFRWIELDRGIKRIMDLIADTPALFAMAKAGQEIAVARHRWGNRVDGILAAARAALARPA